METHQAAGILLRRVLVKRAPRMPFEIPAIELQGLLVLTVLKLAIALEQILVLEQRIELDRARPCRGRLVGAALFLESAGQQQPARGVVGHELGVAAIALRGGGDVSGTLRVLGLEHRLCGGVGTGRARPETR